MFRLAASWLLCFCAGTALAAAAKLDTAKIDQITGAKATYSKKKKVFKTPPPRTDIKFQVAGWSMPPFMGLPSYAAFMAAAQGQAMVRGDPVLLQDEVNPAMSAALDAGLEVT